MCELAAMIAACPTDLGHALQALIPRGGQTGPHADGWGLATYEGRAAHVFKEAQPASQSRCLEFISQSPQRTRLAIAHIRKANPVNTAISLANTHPFEREVQGRTVVFAHNGVLPGVFDLPLGRYRPIGETDSEWAFCLLLERLALVPGIFAEEKLGALAQIVERTALELSALGKCNFLLSEGRHLFAYGHTDLYAVERACRESGCAQRVTLVATEPLTDSEPWRRLPSDRLSVFRDGREIVPSAFAPPSRRIAIS